MTHRRWLIALVLTMTAACGQGVIGSDAVTTSTDESSRSTTAVTTVPATSATTEADASAATTVTSTTVAPTSSTSAESAKDESVTEPLAGEGETPDPYLNAVLADAADRTGVATSDIVVVRSEAVTWRDGSLGCPEPGMSYTQALVSGFWVELEAGGTELDYRLNAEGTFRLCESAGLVVPEPLHKGDPIDPGS